MIKFRSAAATVTVLCATAAVVKPAVAAAVNQSPVAAAATRTPTDFSAARRHYRYVGNRWRVVRPYLSYGVYGPRPHYYRPWPYYLTFPFGFNVGFDPYYW